VRWDRGLKCLRERQKNELGDLPKRASNERELGLPENSQSPHSDYVTRCFFNNVLSREVITAGSLENSAWILVQFGSLKSITFLVGRLKPHFLFSLSVVCFGVSFCQFGLIEIFSLF